MADRRAGVILALIAASALFPLPDARASGTGQGNALLELVRVEPEAPAPGQPVAFTWRVTDPDPVSVVEDLALDYGDARASGQAGTPLMCGEVLRATGLDHTFRTLHRYRVPGTYTVRAEVTTRQRLCGLGLGQADTAPAVERTLTVG